MITTEYGRYKLICDICGESGSGGYDTWDDAKDAKKSLRWISKKESTGWKDICVECQEW